MTFTCMYGFFDSKSKFTTLFFLNIDLTVLLYQKKSIIDLFISLFFFSFYTSILCTPKCIYYKLYIFNINIFGLLLGKRLLYCDFLNTVFSTPTPKETTTKETTTKPNPEITTSSGRITTTEPCNVPTGMVNSKVKRDRSIAGTVVLSVLPVRNFKYCHKCLLLNKKRGQNKTMKNVTSKNRTMRFSFKVNIKNTILKRNSKVSWKNKLKCDVFYQIIIAVSY